MTQTTTTVTAKILYALTPSGQKASLLAGGDGQQYQRLTVDREDAALFARCVQRGSIGADGSVTVDRHYAARYDAPQTADSLLDSLDAADAAEVAAKAARAEAIRAEAQSVLDERRTTKHVEEVGVDREGKHAGWGVAKAMYAYETAHWPYHADGTVKASPAALVWLADLATAKEVAYAAALEEARAKLPAILAAEAAATAEKEERAAKLAARKVEMGGEASDYLCRIEDGAIANVPVYETHSRGKNWFAVITVSPSSPGGLARGFAAKARGDDAYYMLPALAVGDAIEIGGDYYSGSGRKSAERFYGFVVAITDTAVLLRPCSTGKAAVKEGEKFAAASAK